MTNQAKIDAGKYIKGIWIDTPWQRGFEDKPGIYLLHPGSNSCWAGFETVEEAEAFRVTLTKGTWVVTVRV